MTDTDRSTQRSEWLMRVLDARGERLTGPPRPLLADASFRRFERVPTDAGSRVLMDAPPATERNAEFVALARWLRDAGLLAPEVLASDLERGFLLVTDLGDRTLAVELSGAGDADRDRLYRRALDTLVAFQSAMLEAPPPLPAYDRERLDLENALFPGWFVEGLLGLDVPRPLLADTLARLDEVHLGAPRIGVHLDWHSRNLMVTPDGIGIVDFQDARTGPLPYDVVSLLRDCYQRHPAAQVEAWLGHYLQRARAAGLPLPAQGRFRREFDLVGVQRHLKAIGIFARLHLRDGRDHALPDIPRVLAHLLDVTGAHPETRALGGWLRTEVEPALHRWQASRQGAAQ